MSIVTITPTTLSGALFTDKSDREISVGKGQKSQVCMSGYVGSSDVKGDDGEYSPGAFGRLPIEAAKAGDRLVLAVAGGLHGVLFKDTKGKVDYSGNIEAGNGTVYPIFGRLRDGKSGKFISLSSAEAEKRDEDSSSNADQADEEVEETDDIPF